MEDGQRLVQSAHPIEARPELCKQRQVLSLSQDLRDWDKLWSGQPMGQSELHASWNTELDGLFDS